MIRWFCKNGVAANLLMMTIVLVGGGILLLRAPLEVFPEFSLDQISVRVPFRGATPEEVEEGVIIRIEESIVDLQGIKEIRSTASEGVGTVTIELESGYEPRAVLDDVKNRVDAITTFPDDAERPLYSVAIRRREVISVAVSGPLTELELRRTAERIRDDLSNRPEITQVEVSAVRPYEIAIEISEDILDRFGLTFSEVADAIRRSSLDLSAGRIRTPGGEILLRTEAQAYHAPDFADIVIRAEPNGTRVTLADIATIHDGFEEDPLFAKFNGQPCAMIDVYRVGDQSAIDIADVVHDYVKEAAALAPEGVSITYWRDRSKIIRARLSTLSRSAIQGAILVFILLALFLRLPVAVFVCVGIPVSFMGAFVLLPITGVTINIISLFAFILVLGIVVDDAIVTGENIYRHFRKSGDAEDAAVRGTEEVAVPVTFGVLTTVVAFVPLLMIAGVRGKIFAQIPLIVIPVLLFSLIESKFILPSHLKHMRAGSDKSGWFTRMQQRLADALERMVRRFYEPVLARVLEWRYLTLAFSIGAAAVLFATLPSGHLRFVFFPRVQSEIANATLTMPQGTPVAVTEAHIARIQAAAETLQKKYVDPVTGESVIIDMLSLTGSTGRGSGQSHLGRVQFEIVPPEDRTLAITSSQLVQEWRKAIGPLAGARELTFRAEIIHGGSPIDVQLAGQDFDQLGEIASKVREKLAEYPGVFDVADNLNDGKEELRLDLKPEAEQLGLTSRNLARQVRQAFFGEEAQRIQRGRDDVRVMVRYPKDERAAIEDLESMRIRVGDGVEVPFSEVASVTAGRSAASIKRVDRNRTVNITADVDKEAADISGIKADLIIYLDELMENHPGVLYSLEGEDQEQRESFTSLLVGGVLVLFALYALLAIPFRSYLQPLIVMSVIPFGAAMAILGHVLLGKDLSLLSIFGILALTGVVINDSLVLVDYINRQRQHGGGLMQAVREAGVIRFRPILLTSITTFAGLTPLLLEKSTQAQFLIPMAVSLGFGILFTTFVTLLLVPANYMILEDIKAIARWIWFGTPIGEEETSGQETLEPAS